MLDMNQMCVSQFQMRQISSFGKRDLQILHILNYLF